VVESVGPLGYDWPLVDREYKLLAENAGGRSHGFASNISYGGYRTSILNNLNASKKRRWVRRWKHIFEFVVQATGIGSRTRFGLFARN
jgi:hypothetical protein